MHLMREHFLIASIRFRLRLYPLRRTTKRGGCRARRLCRRRRWFPFLPGIQGVHVDRRATICVAASAQPIDPARGIASISAMLGIPAAASITTAHGFPSHVQSCAESCLVTRTAWAKKSLS